MMVYWTKKDIVLANGSGYPRVPGWNLTRVDPGNIFTRIDPGQISTDPGGLGRCRVEIYPGTRRDKFFSFTF